MREWHDLNKEAPIPKTNVTVKIENNFGEEILFYVGNENGIHSFSEDKEMEYVFTAGEEGITHWTY